MKTPNALAAVAAVFTVSSALGQDFATVDTGSFDFGATNSVREPDDVRPADLPRAADAAEAPDRRISATLGLDVANAYYFRGIIQENDGVIIQPWFDVSATLVDRDTWAFGLTAGLWNSVHSDDGTAGDPNLSNWYEADLYVGAVFTAGKFDFGAIYTWYTSPSDAFTTVEDISLFFSFDDSDSGLLFGVPIAPSVTLAFETDNAADGGQEGIFLELGIEPGIDFDNAVGEQTLTLSFPVAVGLSLDDYYEDGTGSDETFGYGQVGAVATLPLPGDGALGDWSWSVGVKALFLGSHTQQYNTGDDTEVIAFTGLEISF